MTIREWALLALAVIGGVPLYALVAGWTARLIGARLPRGMFFHVSSDCPRWWTGADHVRRWGQGPCSCGGDVRAGWLWPVVLPVVAIVPTLRALFYLPARAAHRAAFRGGVTKAGECGPDCGGCE